MGASSIRQHRKKVVRLKIKLNTELSLACHQGVWGMHVYLHLQLDTRWSGQLHIPATVLLVSHWYKIAFGTQ